MPTQEGASAAQPIRRYIGQQRNISFLAAPPPIRSLTTYRRASLIDLYLYTKFHSNRRNFLWTDGRTDGAWTAMDGRTFSPYIIRSTFGSRPKKGLYPPALISDLKSKSNLPSHLKSAFKSENSRLCGLLK